MYHTAVMKRLPRLTLCAVAVVSLALTIPLQGQCDYDVTIIQAPECPPFGFQQTFGLGLNLAGEITGFHCICLCTADQAFRWTAETGLTALVLPPGGSQSRGYDINDAGHIVGSYVSASLGMSALSPAALPSSPTAEQTHRTEQPQCARSRYVEERDVPLL